MAKRLLVKKRKEILSDLTQEIPANGIITVGNDTSATIELNDEKIAPEQFVIVCEEGAMTLLCSVDGTAVNGKPLPQGALHNLEIGDEIKIDGYTLIPDTGEIADNAEPENAQDRKAEKIENPETVLTEKSDRSLSDVLENLRSEEKFYFVIMEPDGTDRRFYVESEEMRLGWTETGECEISSEPEKIEIPRAQIRKDWSGVVLSAVKKGDVRVNEEILTAPRRLKNDDKIYLLSREGTKIDLASPIKFHEPTALLLLDSILPKDLPPPVVLDETARETVNEPDETDFIHSSKIPPKTEKPRRKGNIFGYFTRSEIIFMAIGTLIAAVVIFLILEFY